MVESIAYLLVKVFKGQMGRFITELRLNHTKKNEVLLLQVVTELLPYLM